MSFRKAVCLLIVGCSILASGLGCAKPEKKEEKKKTIRVRAPFTKVDVEIPEDHAKDVKVDVEVNR